jgi:hypothetical protein
LIAKGRRYDSGGIEISEVPDKIDLKRVLPERPEPIIKKGTQLNFDSRLVTLYLLWKGL